MSTAASRAANGELMVALSGIAKRSREAAMGAVMQRHDVREDGNDLMTSEHQSVSQQQQHVQQSPQSNSPLQAAHHVQRRQLPSVQPQPVLQQNSTPQFAPQPSRPVDLLALFQGHASQPPSDVESAPARPPPTTGNDVNSLLRLLQGGGNARL